MTIFGLETELLTLIPHFYMHELYLQKLLFSKD